MGIFRRTVGAIQKGLTKTRDTFGAGVRAVVHGRPLSEELIDEIQDRLITADVGVRTTEKVIGELRKAFRAGRVKRGDDAIEFLKTRLKELFASRDRSIAVAEARPTVVLVAGVNGVGKTTSVAKIAKSLKDDGRSVLLCAADTFRAGAVRQLEIWGERLGVSVVRGAEGADPAAVTFDGVQAAKARGVDVLLVDTAGRIHTDRALMNQLVKIRTIVAKQIPGAPHEVLLVLDAQQGQNAISQAKQFDEALDVTGIFLSKLDGTAKGGIVLAIREHLDIPVKLVGVGETLADVEPFDPDAFVEAMFAEAEAAASR